MGGRSLENDGKHCTIPIPTFCEFNERNHFFNINAITSECSTKMMLFDYEMLINSTFANKTDFEYLGFPRTEDYSNLLKTDKAQYRDYVKSHMIDMNDTEVPQETKDSVEFLLDLTNPLESKLTVNITQNVTLAQSQKKLRGDIIKAEKAKDTYKSRVDTNILILYFDNLSRAHFYRKMPKTAAWLGKFTDDKQDLTVNQFFRYHSVYYNTLWSNNGMYYGETGDLKNTSSNVFDFYRENGYITGFSKDACEMTSNSYDSDESVDSMNIHKWDHHASSFTCDLNYDKSEAVTSLDMFHGKNSILRRCFYGQPIHKYQIEYAKQFWEAYPENRKIFRTHFSEAHEISGELVMYIDDDIVDMLDYFYTNGYFDDTMLMVMSDHGAHSVTIRVPIIPDNSRYIENYLPLLFHLSPKTIPSRSLDALRGNEQSLISSNDIYATLSYIAKNEKYKKFAYVAETIPEDRECLNSDIWLGE
jgi:hypothetical protein